MYTIIYEFIVGKFVFGRINVFYLLRLYLEMVFYRFSGILRYDYRLRSYSNTLKPRHYCRLLRNKPYILHKRQNSYEL